MLTRLRHITADHKDFAWPQYRVGPMGAHAIAYCDNRLDGPPLVLLHGLFDTKATWRRLAYAAHLHRLSGLPLMVSGGRMHGEKRAEATLMKLALRDSFGLEPTWVETQSRNTAENARFSAAMLQQAGIHRVALVSQAWHLPRAVREFEAAGISVLPAPTDFASPPPDSLWAWLPRAYHLRQSSQALHEWLGRGVLEIREWLNNDVAALRDKSVSFWNETVSGAL